MVFHEQPMLEWDDILKIQSYRDDVFRLIIFTMSLTVAILAYAQIHHSYLVVVLCVALMVLTIAYALYSIVRTGRMLQHVENYGVFSSVFYYSCITILASIFFLLLIRKE